MWALNEVEGLVKKAARGAGFPVGQAEDLGRVAAFLAGTGGSIAPVTAALQEPISGVDVRWDNDQVTVVQGPAALIGPIIRDAFAMGCKTAVLAKLAHTPLVGAFLAQSGVAQKWDGKTVMPSDTTVLTPTCKAVAIPDADWQIWLDLAAKTYVPETAASRLAGAGAGLTDND
ncbi:DUF3726 domain-containing protein [Roseobacter sp. CCS2]|uniref:DUF3726 domain-containing protein n=1 Tax=Roseobacter sp. CCS2 TaxID=391593 RepID=UPI0000F3F56C|nr:DUF3726 domain-containing protein [Roseobacter sp. CCS2]EBA10761.1 hypothetical protein RCCS2_11162 [Roseobacter sp. CCS2]